MQPNPNIQNVMKLSKSLKKHKHESSESDEFQLQYHQIKKLGLPVNKKKLRIGNWEYNENLIYLKFLQENRSDFVSQTQRRKNKVFYRLSKILKKRTPDQCRSHHQKLQMKYEDNIDQIISSIRKKLTKKAPNVIEQDSKKIDLSKQKTGLVDQSEQRQVVQTIINEGPYYRVLKIEQNKFQIEIQFEKIQQWC